MEGDTLLPCPDVSPLRQRCMVATDDASIFPFCQGNKEALAYGQEPLCCHLDDIFRVCEGAERDTGCFRVPIHNWIC